MQIRKAGLAKSVDGVGSSGGSTSGGGNEIVQVFCSTPPPARTADAKVSTRPASSDRSSARGGTDSDGGN